jgi:hypothetical protein
LIITMQKVLMRFSVIGSNMVSSFQELSYN